MRPSVRSLLAAGLLIGVALAAGSSSAQADSNRAVAGYFSVQPDLRLCPAPMCGGVFVSLLNRRLTPCPVGGEGEICHASTVDWSRLGLDPAATAELETAVLAGRGLVRGELEPGPRVDGFGALGRLVVTEAWVAAGPRRPRGSFFRVEPNGIVCVTTPCFSLGESLLNTRRKRDVSGLDLAGAGAGEAARQAALRELAGGSLLVAGSNRVVPVDGPAGDGVVLVATQLYLPVRAARPSG